MEDCIFCQIAKKKIPKEFILESEKVMVFADIHPVAPLHLLIVPKKHILELARLETSEQAIWREMMAVVQKLIKKYELMTKGYRLVVNGGGAQLIDHLHIHLMGDISSQRKL